MEKTAQVFVIVVITIYVIFIGVLIYEFIELEKDHKCWLEKSNGKISEKCDEYYGLK